MVYLTKGQFGFIRKEIALQNQGFGFIGQGKSFSDYEYYWNNWPGTPMQ